MPIVGLAIDAERDFQSKYDPDRGKEDASVFIIGTLDSRIFGRIRDNLTEFRASAESQLNQQASASVKKNEVDFLTVQYGLRGWRNVHKHDGEALEFTTVNDNRFGKNYKIVSSQVLRQIPSSVISELAEEIVGSNALDEDEIKN